MADQRQEAKAEDAVKKMHELMTLKDQHRWLRRQNIRKEKRKVKAPISDAGVMPAEQRLPISHFPSE